MKNRRLVLLLALAAAMVFSICIGVVEHRTRSGEGGAVEVLTSTQSISPEIHRDPVAPGMPDPGPSVINLFDADNGARTPWPGTTPAALRARVIQPNVALLQQKPVLKIGDRLTLPLFEDAVLEMIVRDVTCYPNGTVGMTAHLQDGIKGTVYMAYSGGELRIHADVFGGNDYYARYDYEDQVHVAIEVDKASSDYLEKCIEYPVSPPASAGLAVGDLPVTDSSSGDGVAKVMYDTPAGLVIDVMVVYTPAALAYEGSVIAMNNNIALALQKANEAHGNSDTRVALNLVYSAEVPYTEAETLDPVYGWPGDDLDNLTFPGGVNSAMDEVLIWRDEYKADLVCLFEKTDIVGGLAWLLNTTSGNPDQGFCLARVQQSDWTYTVVHEWGHNMGCSHSKGQSSGPWEPGDLLSYSAGWQWSDSESSASIGYCSVMTYEDFDDVGPPYSDEYERVPHFSNPDISYTGNSVNATGDVVDGDNARATRNTRQAVSEYRIRYENFMLYPFASETNTWFQWQTVESSLYSLYWSDYLPSGFSLMASNLTSGVYTDTQHSAEQTGFYKLEPQTIP